ncbi:beta-ketoacyl synthase N-terminal-like domain-containing protein [Streptomyces sp. NPDC052077]|uniref:beta-ketoacyl synthase N-terminal-like domain-containing protein n=1 Tax=Streptomyces sp. NPDC052077 TaxID=3154757 RepID=UPI003428E0C6
MTPSPHPRDAEILARASWPGADDTGPPPPLTGFVVSDFGPMAAEAADRCLWASYGDREELDAARRLRAGRTAVVLGSRGGDLETHTATAAAVDAGRPAAPLLFFQSVPNAIVGHIAKRWGLAGPVICFSPDDATGDPLGEALDIARFLVSGGDADEALVLLVEQVGADGGPGGAEALLVRPAAQPMEAAS